MVGAVGFEPTTPWSQTRCTTRLCYAPISTLKVGVNDGIRTRDNWNHNPGLYQLSYIHHHVMLLTLRHKKTALCGIFYRPLFKSGRSSRIRTYDPLVPNQVHYQAVLCSELGVNDGIRTHDNRNHNPGLYQLSYIHRYNILDSINQANLWCA